MGTKKKQANKSKPEGLILIAIGIASLIFGWLIAFMLWDKIMLPFKNANNITGPLTLISFNPMNNIFRFFVFIFLPSFIFILIYGIQNGFAKILCSFTRLFNIESFSTQNSQTKALHIFIICLFGISIINLIANTTNEQLFPMFAPVEKSIQLDLFP